MSKNIFVVFLGVSFFLLASAVSAKTINIGVVPHVSGEGDAVENTMSQYVGQREDITHVITPATYEAFMDALKKYREGGFKIGKLVIAGHGSGGDPSIQFGADTLIADDLDADVLKEKLKVLRGHMNKYALKSASDPKRYEKKLSELKHDIESLEKKLTFLTEFKGAMEDNGDILLINCSPLASEKGTNFVKRLGAVLFGNKNGRITASREDVTIDQVKSYLVSILKLTERGGIFIEGDWYGFDVNGGVLELNKGYELSNGKTYRLSTLMRSLESKEKSIESLKAKIARGELYFHGEVPPGSNYPKSKKQYERMITAWEAKLAKIIKSGPSNTLSISRAPVTGEWGYSKVKLLESQEKSKVALTKKLSPSSEKHHRGHIAWCDVMIGRWEEKFSEVCEKLRESILVAKEMITLWEQKAQELLNEREAELAHIMKLIDEHRELQVKKRNEELENQRMLIDATRGGL